MTLPQTVVAGLYADPTRFTDTFWGQNFFPRGFPYFLSLYLGALAVGLALAGRASGSRRARLLAGLGLLGLVVSLGRYAGLEPLVEAVPLRALPVPLQGLLHRPSLRRPARRPRPRHPPSAGAPWRARTGSPALLGGARGRDPLARPAARGLARS